MEQSPTFFDPTLFLLFGFMILIYFLMIRPENKRRKTHQDMLASWQAYLDEFSFFYSLDVSSENK